jgi:hypothetical protein
MNMLFGAQIKQMSTDLNANSAPFVRQNKILL